MHYHEVEIELDEWERRQSRANQRTLAMMLAMEQMAKEGYHPYRRTHPHARPLREGRWVVQGRWTYQPRAETH